MPQVRRPAFAFTQASAAIGSPATLVAPTSRHPAQNAVPLHDADSLAARGAPALDALLCEKEAAAYLGLAPKTLAVWRCTKRYALRFVKVGAAVRYKKSDLDAFIAERTHVPEAV